MQREFLLALAIVDLGFSYLTYISQQYFWVFAVPLNLLLPLLSAILFILPFTSLFNRSKKKNAIVAAFLAASILVILLNFSYDYPSQSLLAIAIGDLHAFLIVLSAVAITVVMLYLVGKVKKRLDNNNNRIISYLAVLLLLMLVSGIAYVFMFGFSSNSGWVGVDELAYNYYASFLFLHGVNPYTQSMQPALEQRGTPASLLLSGSYEYSYDYPALSFLPYLPIVALGIKSLFSLVAVLLFLCIASAFTVYYKSRFNSLVLLPLAAWLYFCYSVITVSSAFLAVSVFLLFAYLNRSKITLSATFLGLAASTLQLAWFALPFFYALTLRQQGPIKAAKQIAISALAFLFVNGYFIAISPHATLTNIVTLLGTSQLPPMGPNIMQFFIAYYSEPYSYVNIISIATLLVALCIFYLYGRSARSLLAIAPMLLFFLSWRNAPTYSMPYVPLLLAVYYSGSSADRNKPDILKAKMPIALMLLALALSAIVLALYLHSGYVRSNLLQIDSVISILKPASGGYYTLNSIFVTATNNEATNLTVSFYILSRSPNNAAFIPGSLLPALEPGVSSNFALGYSNGSDQLVNSSTELFVFAFSKDYITGRLLSNIPNESGR